MSALTFKGLPPVFRDWFDGQGWRPHPHQLTMVDHYRAGRSVLLTAPTGGGKTLSGFLPVLLDLYERNTPSPLEGEGRGGGKDSRSSSASRTPPPGLPPQGGEGKRRKLHTLYISPLKALATDIARNLTRPIEEMRLPITVMARTGDSSGTDRRRMRTHPPDILLTTPESLELMLSYTDAAEYFSGLELVIIDEMHSLLVNKRGDLLSLLLARLGKHAPNHRRVGLSATVSEPEYFRRWLGRVEEDASEARKEAKGRKKGKKDLSASPSPLEGEGWGGGKDSRSETSGSTPPPNLPPQGGGKFEDGVREAVHLNVQGGAPPRVEILKVEGGIPWGGFTPKYAAPMLYERIKQHKSTIIFVNTRAQSELMFQHLWECNTENLSIGVHHGSIEREGRQKIERAMASGQMRAIVATSSLDLGIDWGDIELVVQIGAPKGVSRLLQRIGRSNHQLNKASEALLVPANRFEAIECEAAIQAIGARELDTQPLYDGALDVAVQFVVNCACAAPFTAEAMYAEIRSAYPYRNLTPELFAQLMRFAENGGYVLQKYDRFARLARITAKQAAKWTGATEAADPAKAAARERRQAEKANQWTGSYGTKVEVAEDNEDALSPFDKRIFGKALSPLEGEGWGGWLVPHINDAEFTGRTPPPGLPPQGEEGKEDRGQKAESALSPAPCERQYGAQRGQKIYFVIASKAHEKRHRMNLGTIVEAATLKVKLLTGKGHRGRVLGEVEEWFANGITPGDTFMFSGLLLQFKGMDGLILECNLSPENEPRVPTYAGGRMPLTTYLAERVQAILGDPPQWETLPPSVQEWLQLQQVRSVLPEPGKFLVETFFRANGGRFAGMREVTSDRKREKETDGRWYLVAYCFAGRYAHQTLGMLLTRRMERAGLKPLGFVANDYAIAVWGLREPEDVETLFDVDLLGDDLEDWLAESQMLKRSFGRIAVIAGLIERRHPGQEKTGRQVMFSTDLLYDTLRRYEPDHILFTITREDAFRELVGTYRLSAMLHAMQGHIVHRRLDRPSPLSLPTIIEIAGRQPIHGEGTVELLERAAATEELIAEATGD